MAASFWPHIKAILMSDPRHCSRKCATFWMSWMSWRMRMRLELLAGISCSFPRPEFWGSQE